MHLKKNDKKLLRFVVLVLVAGLVAATCQQTPTLNRKTVAVVGRYAIPFEKYKKRYADYLDATSQKDNLYLRLGVLRNMINEIILKHYDDNTEIYDNPEYKKELAWAKREMVLGYLKGVEVYDKIKVSDAEARQAFLRVNEKIAARHLYAKTKEEAENLYRKVVKGANWDSLARVVFTDSVLKSNGGYLGYFTWGDMDPAFEDTAYQMKPGQISHPVKTAHGYSIIKVEDRKRVPIITENEYLNKKEKIIRLLRMRRKKKAERAFLKTVFNEKELNFDTKGLTALLDLLKNSPNGQKELAPQKMRLTAATYQGNTFTVGALYKEIMQIPAFHRQKIVDLSTLKTAIKGLLINQKLWKMALAKHYDQVPEVQEAIENAENNIYLKYKRAQILAAATVPDSTLRHYYKKEIFKFNSPRMINVREILVENWQQALTLKKRLLDGADFSALARQYSVRSWSAQNGGEIGYSEWARFGKLKDKLWKAPIGQIIGPLEIKPGLYGLFRVEGKKDAAPLPFDQIKQAVLKEYKGENQTELIRAYLEQLRAKVQIKRNLPLVKSFRLAEDPN